MTVLADFEVHVNYDPPRAVRVVIYDSLKGLRIAASKHENRGVRKKNRKAGQYANTLGICHRFENYDKQGQLKPVCAIVRLAAPHLGVGIASHELFHAAVWFRELEGDNEPLTTHNDEPFAWVLGELVRQTINSMREFGVFNED